jgi:CBS-domain-containing membrane protein
MLKAKDIMTRNVISVHPDMEIANAAALLFEHHINGVPVVDKDEKLIGILCQSDLIAQQQTIPIPSLFTFLDGYIPFTSLKKVEKTGQKIAALTVADAMTPDPVTVSPETDIETIATLMVNKNFHSIPVVEGSQVVGMIGKEDILQTLIKGK